MNALMRAARMGQAYERRRILRMLDEMAWGASISPQPAAPVVVERLQWLRDSIEPPRGLPRRPVPR